MAVTREDLEQALNVINYQQVRGNRATINDAIDGLSSVLMVVFYRLEQLEKQIKSIEDEIHDILGG